MRTTIDLPDDVLRSAEIAAEERHTTLLDLVSQALRRELGLAPEAKPTGKRVTFPILDSVAPGSLNLTNEDLKRLDEEEDARQYQLAFGDKQSMPYDEESFDSLAMAFSKAVNKLKELGGRNAFPEDEEMVALLQNPGNGELWKRFAIKVQLAGEEEFESISLEDVLDFLEIAAGLNPSDVEAVSELGHFLFAVCDEVGDALMVLRASRECCLSQLEECTGGMATCLVEMGQLEEARKIVEETLVIRPDAEELLDILHDVDEFESSN
jgi:tetratricopeptide (TPR) repeat protein